MRLAPNRTFLKWSDLYAAMDQREYRYNSYQSRPSGSGYSDYPQHGTRQKTGKVLLRRQLRRLCRVRFLPQ